MEKIEVYVGKNRAYKNLANAIVIQAVEDMRTVCEMERAEQVRPHESARRVMPHEMLKIGDGEPPLPSPRERNQAKSDKPLPASCYTEDEKNLCQFKHFFHSKWFELLSDLNGDLLYREILEEVASEEVTR